LEPRYSKPEHYGIVEVPLPKLRDNDVLIKVKACGVCGTDLHIHEGEFIAKVREASYIEVSSKLSTFRLAVLGRLNTWMATIDRLNPPPVHSFLWFRS
jgi:D-arabinitol dehydrogenase (NADP+)